MEEQYETEIMLSNV